MKIKRTMTVLLSAIIMAASALSAQAAVAVPSEDRTDRSIPIGIAAIAAGGLVSIGIVRFKNRSEDDDE